MDKTPKRAMLQAEIERAEDAQRRWLSDEEAFEKAQYLSVRAKARRDRWWAKDNDDRYPQLAVRNLALIAEEDPDSLCRVYGRHRESIGAVVGVDSRGLVVKTPFGTRIYLVESTDERDLRQVKWECR